MSDVTFHLTFWNTLQHIHKTVKTQTLNDINFVPKYQILNLNVIGNRDIRKRFTQFRVSAHDLSTEKGSYNNIKLENRTCKNCQSLEIEDEFHFLITCLQYIAEREILFSYSMLQNIV